MKGTVERALELARSGRCASIEDIRRLLAREGHEGVAVHLNGVSFRKQLRGLIAQARESRAPVAD